MKRSWPNLRCCPATCLESLSTLALLRTGQSWAQISVRTSDILNIVLVVFLRPSDKWDNKLLHGRFLPYHFKSIIHYSSDALVSMLCAHETNCWLPQTGIQISWDPGLRSHSKSVSQLSDYYFCASFCDTFRHFLNETAKICL